MSEPIGVAMIGTGMWGKRLTPFLKRIPSLRLITCYSRDAHKRAAFAEEFDCDAAPSFEAAIQSPDVGGVLLLTPNNVHAEQTIACAQLGKHVFVEKPIADHLEDGRAMREACISAGVTLMVGHAFRRLGAARKVKQLIEEGALGQIVLAEANFSLPSNLTPDRWRFYRQTCPGGPLMQLGVHHADTLQYWFGPARHVTGSFVRMATTAEIDDVGVALVEYRDGTRATLTSSYVSPKTFSLRLYGTEANLHYETDMSIWPRADQMDAATTLTLQTRKARSIVDFEPRDMLSEELSEFAACMRGETEPETGAVEALAALEVIRGALESHEHGRIYSMESE
jgi:predicted dehydrogenase